MDRSESQSDSALDWESGFMSGWSSLLPGSSPAIESSEPSIRVRGVAHSGGGWMAAARTEGLLILATGRGRGLPLAAALPSVIETTIAVSAGEPCEGGLPATAAAVLRLLRATHLDLRQDPEGLGSEGLETLVAVIAEGRLFVIQAGGGAKCARWRQGRWEVVAPLGDRARPALGAVPKVVIEVTSEPLQEGDLVVALTPAPAGASPSAGQISEALTAWAGNPDREPSAPVGAEGPAYAALLYGEVSGMGSPGRWVTDTVALLAPEEMAPIDLAGYEEIPGEEPAPQVVTLPIALPKAVVAAGGASLRIVDLSNPELAMTAPLPSAMSAPLPSALPDLGLEPPGATAVASKPRSRQWLIRGGTAMAAVTIGVVGVLAAGRIWDWGAARQEKRVTTARPGSPPPPITASAGQAAGGDGIEALAPGTAPATGVGSLSARTEPQVSEIDIYVDDRLVGRAPAALDRLPVGQHRVRFVGPDHYRWEEEVMVREGEMTEAVAPIDRGEERALITVRGSSLSKDGLAEEEGDEVLVDGERRGVTPIELRLDPGVHAITVRRSGGDALPITRVLEVRRSDRFILTLRVDQPPRFAIEHRPQREIRTGETPLLTATCGPGSSTRQSLYLHSATDSGWTKLSMAPVPGAPGTLVLGLPIGSDYRGKKVRYYFSTVDEGGETIFSPIYSVPLR